MAKKIRSKGTPPAASTGKGAKVNSGKNHGRKIAQRNNDVNTFGDPSDLLKEHYSIHFFHIPTASKVSFKGWVTSFSDSYTSNWNTDEAYGRMDPITTFQNTSRVITIEWDVISAHMTEAKQNMTNCEMLFKMLYPTYISKDNSAGTISAAPLFKIKFGNLISKAGQAAIADVATSGLVGTIGGFDYSPDFDAGFFLDAGSMYPQTISLSAEIQIIHNFQVGWDAAAGGFRTENYPYGNGKSSTTIEPVGSAGSDNSLKAKKSIEKGILSPSQSKRKR